MQLMVRVKDLSSKLEQLSSKITSALRMGSPWVLSSATVQDELQRRVPLAASLETAELKFEST